LLLGFFAWAFYLYNIMSHKKKTEPLMKQKDELIANTVKLENLRYLSIANLSKFTLLFMHFYFINYNFLYFS